MSVTINEEFRLVVKDYLQQMAAEGISSISPDTAYTWLRLNSARIDYAMSIACLSDLIPEYNTTTELARLSKILTQMIEGERHD